MKELIDTERDYINDLKEALDVSYIKSMPPLRHLFFFFFGV